MVLPFCFLRLRVADGFSFLGEAHRVLSTISPQKETREPLKLRADQNRWISVLEDEGSGKNPDPKIAATKNRVKRSAVI